MPPTGYRTTAAVNVVVVVGVVLWCRGSIWVRRVYEDTCQ